ncbi:sugar phosphate isomerase/epimerase family protein [Planctomicrobium sp. SH668]|uniref:sugar phosphate isomerase/epimerase family protein n=1 Tax=Planctomicrobium sp. SH668 TaxID=3448126 RepID=UPI003F5BA808
MQVVRRDFLKLTAAAVLSSGLSHRTLLSADDVPPRMKLGLVTYQWGKDWDVETLINNCVAANFSGVELRTTHKHGVELELNQLERATVKKQFSESGIAPVGIGSACEYHSTDPAILRKNIDETKAFVRLSHDIGGSGVKVRPNALPTEVPVEQTIEQIGAALREVAADAADFGQQIRVEVHGKETQEIPMMHRIMQAADHPNVGICWNCNPADLHGEGLAANFRLLQDRLFTVHIHDLTQQTYPWEELFQLLNGIPFEGWTLLEDGNVPSDIVSAMQANRQEWERLIRVAPAAR